MLIRPSNLGDASRQTAAPADASPTSNEMATQIAGASGTVAKISFTGASADAVSSAISGAKPSDDKGEREIVFSVGVAPDPPKPNARIYNLGSCITGEKPVASAIYQVLSVASPGIGFYHGYKKNGGSIGYGLWWGLMGMIFPVITPAIALADGLGKETA